MSGIVPKRGFEKISSTSEHASIEDDGVDTAKKGRKEATPPAVSAVLGKRPPESESAPIKKSRVSSLADEDNFPPHIAEQTNGEDLLSVLPDELLEHITGFCPTNALLLLTGASQKLRRIAFDRLHSRLTGAHSIEKHAEEEVRAGFKEVAKIALRMDTLRKGGVKLPADMINLHDRIVRHGDRNDAEKLKRFLDFRDNLILWKSLGQSQFDVNTGTSYDEFEHAYQQLGAIRAAYVKNHPIVSFDLSNQQLSSIPSDVLNYRGIVEELCLDDNFITEIPKEIKELIYLKLLSLKDNKITVIPDEIGNLIQLQQLALNHNQIADIPACLGKLTQLQKLWLNQNQIADIPACLGNLTRLQWLVLDNNKISEIPACVGNLTQLHLLGLNQNQINEIPACLGNLSQLQSLGLDNNNIAEIPACVGNLSQLQSLWLSQNQIAEIPACVGSLIQLRKLGLTQNQITEIPACVGNLPQLNELWLEGNPLKELPDFLKNRKGLKLKF